MYRLSAPQNSRVVRKTAQHGIQTFEYRCWYCNANANANANTNTNANANTNASTTATANTNTNARTNFGRRQTCPQLNDGPAAVSLREIPETSTESLEES